MDLDLFWQALRERLATQSDTVPAIEVIKTMTSEATDSYADVQRLCRLAGLPRATYYRRLTGQDRKAADCELSDQHGFGRVSRQYRPVLHTRRFAVPCKARKMQQHREARRAFDQVPIARRQGPK